MRQHPSLRGPSELTACFGHGIQHLANRLCSFSEGTFVIRVRLPGCPELCEKTLILPGVMTLSSPAGPNCPFKCHPDPPGVQGPFSPMAQEPHTSTIWGLQCNCVCLQPFLENRLLGSRGLHFDYIILSDPASLKLLGESMPHQLHLLFAAIAGLAPSYTLVMGHFLPFWGCCDQHLGLPTVIRFCVPPQGGTSSAGATFRSQVCRTED